MSIQNVEVLLKIKCLLTFPQNFPKLNSFQHFDCQRQLFVVNQEITERPMKRRHLAVCSQLELDVAFPDFQS